MIPRGGACPLGVIGHVLAVAETMAQCAADRHLAAMRGHGRRVGRNLGWLAPGLPPLRRIVAGRGHHREPRRRRGAREPRRSLAAEAAQRLSCPAAAQYDDTLIVHDGFIGAGYGIPSAEGR